MKIRGKSLETLEKALPRLKKTNPVKAAHVLGKIRLMKNDRRIK